jgi:homogentisate 1,2-dioxygenase
MRSYRRLGAVPRKRHMKFEHEGRPVFEELFGREGFGGPSALLYHRFLPEGAHDVRAGTPDLSSRQLEPEEVHEHAHIRGYELTAGGDVISDRNWIFVNDDVQIGLACPARQQEHLFVNASADELLFLHRGTGVLHTQFGRISARQGDYLVVPRGTVYRLELAAPEASRILIIETAGMIDSPDRYRTRNGQLNEMSPYSERDIRSPEHLEEGKGSAEVWLKRGNRITRYSLDHHPFDVVGWDGGIYPCAFSIHDFEPRAGRFHVPPPMHQTFQARNIVICSFVPRKVDWDPDANFLPYHHSNLDSDEILYYCGGNYAARRGIREGSFTQHVGGVPHGPQPGAYEASLDKPRETDEMAVMIDTFRPLRRTALARDLFDDGYPYSWHTGEVPGPLTLE